MRRGRPRTITAARPYPNRLRALRERLSLSQERVAGQAGISLAYYGALERGDRRINADTAQRLHLVLGCAPGDLLQPEGAASVPLRMAIAAADSEGRPEQFDLPPPYEWLQPRRLDDPENCFAAEIYDDSAELDYPRGSVLFVRPLASPEAALPSGSKVVVRFLLPSVGGGPAPTHEILYGLLDQTVIGDVLLITRTRNRLVPRNAMIQSQPPPNGLAERPVLVAPRGGRIVYEKRRDDPAEILGLVVYSMAPA